MLSLILYKIERKDILVFFIGLLSVVHIRVLGTFGVSELLCFALYFVVANPFSWMRDKGMTHLFFATLIWLLGVFISDQYNGTNFTDSLKGFFNVAFVLLLIPFVYWALYDNPRRMLFFWVGNALSSILSFYFQKVSDLDELGTDVWSVYAYYYLFIVISGILYYRGKTLWACAVIEGFAVWSLFHLSRNVFLTMTIAVCVILFINHIKADNLQIIINAYQRKLIGLFCVLIIAFFGINLTYEYLASNRILGDRAYNKWYMQKHSELGLVSGRGDFLQSVYLVAKQPIFGYGSYAKNKGNILAEYYISNNMKFNPTNVHDKMLPGHSYLMGGWVYAGILGLAFWIYIIYLIVRFLREGLLYDKKLLGINTLLTFATLWNILFSPFANRLNFLAYIVTTILISNFRNDYEKLSNENIDNNTLL